MALPTEIHLLLLEGLDQGPVQILPRGVKAVINQGAWDAKPFSAPVGAALVVVHDKQNDLCPAPVAALGQGFEVAAFPGGHHTEPQGLPG